MWNQHCSKPSFVDRHHCLTVSATSLSTPSLTRVEDISILLTLLESARRIAEDNTTPQRIAYAY